MKISFEDLRHDVLWGLGLGVAASACIQILTWVGLGLSHLTWISTYLCVVLFAALAGRSLAVRGRARPGMLRAAWMLVVMILVGRVIYQTYMFVYINHVDPSWVDDVAVFWEAQMRDAGMAREAIGANLADFRNQWQTGYVFTLGVVRYALAQFVVGFATLLITTLQPWRRQR